MKSKKTVLTLILSLLLTIIILLILHFETEDKNEIVFPISSNIEDIVIGKNSATNSLIVFYSYNCKYCKNFFIDFSPFTDDSLLKKFDLKIILKPLAMSQSESEFYALQTLIGLYLHGDPLKIHQLFLHNYNIAFRDEFIELTDKFINDNPNFAESLLKNDDYTYLKKNLVEFNINNLKVTPTFIINNRKFKGYKDKATFEKLLRKEIN